MKSLTTTMLADNFNFLEGPRWRDGKLWLSDMQGRTIYTLTEDGAREGASFVKDHIISITPHAFDDFANAETNVAANKRILGLEDK